MPKVLHIINQSVFKQTSVRNFLQRPSHGDHVLFTEEGVYNALSCSPVVGQLEWLQGQDIQLYALSNDVRARALMQRLLPSVVMVDDADFVDLVVQTSKTVTWR